MQEKVQCQQKIRERLFTWQAERDHKGAEASFLMCLCCAARPSLELSHYCSKGLTSGLPERGCLHHRETPARKYADTEEDAGTLAQFDLTSGRKTEELDG